MIELTAKEIRILLRKKEIDKYSFEFMGEAYNNNWMIQKFLIVKRKSDGQKFINVNSFLSASDKDLNKKFYFKKYM